MSDLLSMLLVPDAATAKYYDLENFFSQIKEAIGIALLERLTNLGILQYGDHVSLKMGHDKLDPNEERRKAVYECGIAHAVISGESSYHYYVFFNNGEVEIRSDFNSESTIETLPNWEIAKRRMIDGIRRFIQCVSSTSNQCLQQINLLLQPHFEPVPPPVAA